MRGVSKAGTVPGPLLAHTRHPTWSQLKGAERHRRKDLIGMRVLFRFQRAGGGVTGLETQI